MNIELGEADVESIVRDHVADRLCLDREEVAKWPVSWDTEDNGGYWIRVAVPLKVLAKG